MRVVGLVRYFWHRVRSLEVMLAGAGVCALLVVAQARPARVPDAVLPQPDNTDEYIAKCEAGEAGSCQHLGWWFEFGINRPRDTGRARYFNERACSGGDIDGCIALAEMHDFAIGIARNSAKAASLYGSACAAGRMKACTLLGWLYAQGEGVNKPAGWIIAIDAARYALLSIPVAAQP